MDSNLLGWAGIVIATLSALGTVLNIIWQNRRDDKKSPSEITRNDGEAAESISEAVKILLDPLKERIVILEAGRKEDQKTIGDLTVKLERQNFQLGELKAGVAVLTNQILQLGHTPNYSPTNKD